MRGMVEGGARRLRLVGSLVAVVFLAGSARAFDVTACGQTVPPGQQGVLTVDLVCPRLPEGNPPAVTVGDGATLSLNGHSIDASRNTAVMAESGRITVTGPGELTGSNIAIQGAGPVTVMNVSIHDDQVGILTDLDARRGVVRATNVSIADSIDNSGDGGPGLGVQANTVIADGLTVPTPPSTASSSGGSRGETWSRATVVTCTRTAAVRASASWRTE